MKVRKLLARRLSMPGRRRIIRIRTALLNSPYRGSLDGTRIGAALKNKEN
jgi:hypothetical protein